MNSVHALVRCRALAWLAFGAASTFAQAPAVDPVTLARYDKNRNGVLDPPELEAMAADSRRSVPVVTPVGPGTAGAGDETIVMSPFEVVTDTKGYYAATTMSGTRFNARLEDLASAITVVTKEQMADFGMLDINDIFNYTANTEGTWTYTDFEVDRNGSVSDNVQLNPTQANRVRGIAAANISLGNIETSGRTPIDPLALDAIEVSRGPNATIFGLGSPSGTVNLVPSAASLTRNRAQFQARGDRDGGYRSSLDVSRVVKHGVLGLRASASFQHDSFVRKPSGVNTVRYNGMIKYQPFKSTSITGSYSFYRMHGTRPNFSPPRDNLTNWIASGRPAWDPVTQRVTLAGATLGPFTSDSSLPGYFTNSHYGAKSGQNLGFWYIGPGGLEYWSTQGTNSGNNPDATGTIRFVSSNAVSGASGGVLSSTQPLFSTTPTVSDKSIYDWSAINIAAVNRIMDETLTSSLQIDQIFLNSRRHTIAAQFAFRREESERYKRNLIGVANDNGQSGQLFVDVNARLLDGTPNPYFGRPYIGVAQPWTQWQPLTYDTSRAQAAYKLDLAGERGFLRWLGTHQLSGYYEYKYRTARTRTYRDAVIDDHPWIPAGTSRGAGSIFSARGYHRYYLGDANGHNVDYAPGELTYGTYPFVWGNFATGAINREPARLGLVAITSSTSGTKSILKTRGGVLQSHLLGERLVTTFGLRDDAIYSKGGAPVRLNPDGMTFDDSVNHWALGDYAYRTGKTRQAGVVVRPFRGLAFLRRIDSGGGPARLLAGALRGLAITYNESDSFSPMSPAQDLFLRPLPHTTGEGRDYGFALNVLDGKFVLRANRYDTRQFNLSGGDANTLSRRVLRYDIPSPAAESTPYMLHDRAFDWTRAQHPTWTDQQIEEDVARQIGIPLALQQGLEIQDPSLGARNHRQAKGTEIELNYNPSRYWTMAASATETQSIESGVGTALAEWISQRLPIWTTIRDPRTGNLWWTTNYGGNQTAAQNFAAYVGAPFGLMQQLEGKPKSQVRRYNARFSTRVDLAGFVVQPLLKRCHLGGSLRWADKAAIGFYGRQSLPASITELDGNRPIYDQAQHYVDLFLGYRTKLWANRVSATFQFNARNLQEGGGLQPIGVYPDGTPHTYRIVDPRQFIVTATFDY